MAILEAAASGLPIVSTRHAGIPDVVLDGVTGFLGDERDVTTMAEKMRILLEQPRLAGQMGSAGRNTVVEHFSMQQSIQRLWGIIETCIHGKRLAEAPATSHAIDSSYAEERLAAARDT